MEAVRVSGQTRALVKGSPVVESHTMVVSRWFVIPIDERAERSFPWDLNFLVAPDMQFKTDLMISLGSCSNQLMQSGHYLQERGEYPGCC